MPPQCIHSLKATGLRIRLLLNFGNPRVAIQYFADGL